MNHTLQKGETVRLKSGGPTMTIELIGQFGLEDTPSAKCVWFDGKDPKEKVFALDVLEFIDTKAPRRMSFA